MLHASRPRVVHCLRLRWRQENSFKFLTENYAIDQIIQYRAEKEHAERLLPNPRAQTLNERIRSVAEQIVSSISCRYMLPKEAGGGPTPPIE
jgi:hypothetical protein